MSGIAVWHVLILVVYLVVPIAIIVGVGFLVRRFLRRRETQAAPSESHEAEPDARIESSGSAGAGEQQ